MRCALRYFGQEARRQRYCPHFQKALIAVLRVTRFCCVVPSTTSAIQPSASRVFHEFCCTSEPSAILASRPSVSSRSHPTRKRGSRPSHVTMPCGSVLWPSRQRGLVVMPLGTFVKTLKEALQMMVPTALCVDRYQINRDCILGISEVSHDASLSDRARIQCDRGVLYGETSVP